MERILDLRPEQLMALSGKDVVESILAAEGRTVMSEIVCPTAPLCGDVSNGELAAAMGSDIILLNMLDMENPVIAGVQEELGESVIGAAKRKIGRLLAVNLEPIDENAEIVGEQIQISNGRKASRENAAKAVSQGIGIILLTGNPKTGVSHASIVRALKDLGPTVDGKGILLAGRMHAAGLGRDCVPKAKELEEYAEAGAKGVLIPAPGTVPGMTLEEAAGACRLIHHMGMLAITAIGTSQEGADSQTIRSIALAAKMAGADIHHIGDAGYGGVAIPENIMEYSVAIRGRRHTFRRMAMRV